MDKYLKKELVIDDFKHQRYFTPFELNRDNLLFVDFFFYLDQYYHDNKIKKVDVYNQMFSVFNKILRRFFQDPLKINNNSRKSIKIHLIKYLLLRYVLVNQQYEKDISRLFQDSGFVELRDLEKIDKVGYLKLISRLYQDINVLGDGIDCQKQKHQIEIKDFDRKDVLFQRKEYHTIAFLQDEVKKKLSQQIDFFLIQGSYATADYVKNWSDLDTFIVLNKEIFNNLDKLKYTQKELQQLGLLCYKINPLAHHTFFIYPDLVLKNYSNQFLPIPVLEKSVALFKKGNLSFNFINNRLADFYILRAYVNRFREKVINEKYSENLFKYEHDIADAITLPTFMLQMKGEPIYKKFSFKRVKAVFPDFDLSFIDLASDKRKNWQLFNWLNFYPNWLFNLLPACLNDCLINKYRFYLMRFKKPDSWDAKNFAQKNLDLYETFFNYCLENFKYES